MLLDYVICTKSKVENSEEELNYLNTQQVKKLKRRKNTLSLSFSKELTIVYFIMFLFIQISLLMLVACTLQFVLINLT